MGCGVHDSHGVPGTAAGVGPQGGAAMAGADAEAALSKACCPMIREARGEAGHQGGEVA